MVGALNTSPLLTAVIFKACPQSPSESCSCIKLLVVIVFHSSKSARLPTGAGYQRVKPKPKVVPPEAAVTICATPPTIAFVFPEYSFHDHPIGP